MDCIFQLLDFFIMSAEAFSDNFEEIVNQRKQQPWNIPLETHLEEYSKKLRDILSADDGFTKLNFSEPAFIVSRAAKLWGKKVDNLDDFLHSILQRALTGHDREITDGDNSVINSEDSDLPAAPETAPKRPKQQRTIPWTLDDLKASADIFRPVPYLECDTIDMNENQNEVDLRNKLRPRIIFDLHPVYRLPVSIQVKNVKGESVGDYCDFFSNTFDAEHVSRLLETNVANADRTLEMLDANDEESIGFQENDQLFIEPVRLEADSDPAMNICPDLQSGEPTSQLPPEPMESQDPTSQEFHPPTSVMESQPFGDSEHAMDVPSQPVTEREQQRKAVAVNKFLVRLDPYDDSQESKRRKPLASLPGKTYKLPSAKQKQAVADPINVSMDGRRVGDIFSKHMPPLKPPSQMPPSIADSVYVELSELMMQKFDDAVLEACGRKSYSRRARDAPSEPEVAEIPLSQEVLKPPAGLDEESDAEDGGIDAFDMGVELPGLPGNEMEDGISSALEALPDVQSLEDILPPDVYDESRIKRVQAWDRYVEQRLADIERTPFDVNDYCHRMVALTQKAGKKWTSVETAVIKMVSEKDKAQDLSVRRESARSLVSLLFLANNGNMEFRRKIEGNALEVRLLSDSIGHVSMSDGVGGQSPQRVALAAHHQ